MGIGDTSRVETGGCTDLYYVDPGVYEVPGHTSVYVLDAERPAIVETGIGKHTDRVLSAIDDLGIGREEIEVIALTHVHLDHAGGAGTLAEACPNAEVVVHDRGAPHLADPSTLVAGTKQVVGESGWQFYAEPDPVPEDRIRTVTDGDAVDLGDHRLAVHHAPGHATHQTVLHDPANDAVFTADVLGCFYDPLDAARVATPPPTFDLDQCLADVDLLREIGAETLLYSHFGPRQADGALDAYADVLKAWVARVAQARRRHEDDRAAFKFLLEQNDVPGGWSDDLEYGELRMNFSGAVTYLDRQDATAAADGRERPPAE
ncbi:MBL fold metallo-hydrolase [Halorientalis halophila]|uniref:MBL fold metallo-hydrolase n=1 Tax=Halorientalis halophila TaxID=3108499 RepID=UPI00300A09C5